MCYVQFKNLSIFIMNKYAKNSAAKKAFKYLTESPRVVKEFTYDNPGAFTLVIFLFLSVNLCFLQSKFHNVHNFRDGKSKRIIIGLVNATCGMPGPLPWAGYMVTGINHGFKPGRPT